MILGARRRTPVQPHWFLPPPRVVELKRAKEKQQETSSTNDRSSGSTAAASDWTSSQVNIEPRRRERCTDLEPVITAGSLFNTAGRTDPGLTFPRSQAEVNSQGVSPEVYPQSSAQRVLGGLTWSTLAPEFFTELDVLYDVELIPELQVLD